MNRKILFTDQSGGQNKYRYDEVGNLLEIEDQSGNQTQYEYNPTNRLSKITHPNGNQVKYDRDLLDRVYRITNARGQVISRQFDADGRLITKRLGADTVIEYGYDPAGNLTTLTDPSGQTKYEYTDRNRVNKIVYPDQKELKSEYDKIGNLVKLTYPNGLMVHYTYDSRNRFQTITWEDQSVEITHNKNSWITQLNRSNGTRTTKTYDQNGRLKSIHHTKGSQAIAKYTFTRNKNGHTLTEDQILPIPRFLFRENKPGTTGSANQLQTWDGADIDHDKDGNCTSYGVFSAEYDSENRLIKYIANGRETINRYDGLGRRISAKTGIWERNFFYDSEDRLLFETDGEGKITVSYIWMGNRLLARQTQGKILFYHLD
jgi:YD repeat-containing protein